MTKPDLSAQVMVDAACTEIGLTNFGLPAFIEAFEVHVECAAKEVHFHPMGLAGFKADMHRLLVNRLRFEEDMRLHPEILDEDISDPIIILGLVRTGTSKLQRMMSSDPHVQKLYFWRLLNPAPFPGNTPGEDPRIEVARQTSGMLAKLAPDFMTAHPTLAEDVDEELLLLEFSFKTIVHYLLTPAPGYYAWLMRQSLRDAYQDLGRLIKYLQWQDGGKRNRPWIMKSPLHLGNLDALLEVFPKATLVHCHRDVSEVIASYSRLNEVTWQMKTVQYTSQEVGQAMLKVWSTEMRKYLQLRKKLSPKRDIFDVRYDEINRDPMPVIREIYRRAGRPLGEESVNAMLKWSHENPKDRFGKNIYTLEQFGLTRKIVEEAFRDYIEQFQPYL